MKKTLTPSRIDYRNPFMEVRHTKADFGAFQKDYFVIDLGPRAGLVAIRGDSVLLTRQYRFLIDDFSWELPGGQVHQGETAESAAVRECLEETGFQCSKLSKLVQYYPGLDNFNNRTTLFSSTNVEVARPFLPEASEVVEVRWFSVGEALGMVLSGEILDGLTVTGLMAYETIGRHRTT